MFNDNFTIFITLFSGLLIAANPYLAIKIYPENQNVWQDCYAIPMASTTFIITKKLYFNYLEIYFVKKVYNNFVT
ncbi:hypothetical protein HMPREF1552_01506 [Leptotrichia sp. oral taxon 879 str. F0557]|nr:hypothetical protein HMPREF1552_01506 [Leptotrichia sp. oral taxon 879 str. F0557]